MRLNIVKKSTGREIMAAFLRAAHYQESAEVRWEAVDFEDATGNRGAIAYPCQRKKRFRFFGPDRWVRDFDAEIYLHPLALNDEHDEIQVEVRLARPSQREVVNDKIYNEWWERYHYFHRQLTLILKNAFLLE